MNYDCMQRRIFTGMAVSIFAIAVTMATPGHGVVPREETAQVVAEATLEHPDAGRLPFALSALWVGDRADEGNEQLRKWFRTGHRTDEPLELLLEKPEEYPEELTKALGGVKWMARTWLRIYYLFSDESPFFAGRLAPDVQEKLEQLCWAYGLQQSTIERADPKYVWAIQGSENHDMMDLSNAYLALQAVQDHPRYRERELTDGHTPREHVAAWAAYYRNYASERAAYGLSVEISSAIYGKHFLGELFNLHDFAEDEGLRKKMGMLLDLTWADWAVDQLGGVRGGGKTRTYFGHYAERGTSDSWYTMSNFLFERPTEGQLNWAARHGQVEFSIVTSGYRLPDVVAGIAREKKGDEVFEYISRRPGKMLRPEEVRDAPPLRDGTWYHMDAGDSRLVRYSYCAPEYVLGSLWVDPALGTEFRVAPDHKPDEEENYAAISSQSQWQGIIFPTDHNARVFPQCEGEQSRNRVNYQQHVAVQHKNVMLVQKHRKAQSAGAMRVYFAPGMKERVNESDGWLFLREGDAFLAVGILSPGGGATAAQYRWNGDNWVTLRDEFAPVVFVAGRASRHEGLEAFSDWVRGHEHVFSEEKLTYTFADEDGREVALALWTGEVQRLPEIDGAPIDLRPEKVYDSPYLSAEFGSSLITIKNGDRILVQDFETAETSGNARQRSVKSSH